MYRIIIRNEHILYNVTVHQAGHLPSIVFCKRSVVCLLVCLERGVCVEVFRILIIRFPSRMSGITDFQNVHLYVYGRI